MFWIALRFRSLPPKALPPLAGWACQFTPSVSLEPPDALLLEAQGSLRLFQGPAALAQRLESELAGMGLESAWASDATALAALWRARSGAPTLAEVPLESAFRGDTAAFLAGLGIATVGELLALPREGLARRCGPGLLEQLDRACGHRPDPRPFHVPPAAFSAEVQFPEPVQEAQALLFSARRLLAQLEGLLAARQEGVRAFCALLLRRRAAPLPIEVGLASLAREASRLLPLLRERLERTALDAPVEGLRIEARDFEPLAGRSRGLFGEAADEEEDWARLVERLKARLGGESVHGLALQADHRPEHAWRRVEPGEWDPRPVQVPGPRPVWLLEPPRRLDEQGLLLLAGPERIESGWWDGDDARRDYFVVRMADGGLGWAYREPDGWFLHGLFA